MVCIRVARFFLVQNTKTRKNIPNYHGLYQMSIKYNKRPFNGPIVHKIYQHCKTIVRPPKFTQIWIFGLKTNQLATLVGMNQSLISCSCVNVVKSIVEQPLSECPQRDPATPSDWEVFSRSIQLSYKKFF
jgi:hypothetical protein